MTTHKRNFFDMLGDDCDDIDNTKETEQLERKAKKKLREIEKLKKKKIRTPEENKKIAEEPYWEQIARPVEEEEGIPSQREIDIRNRQEKQYEAVKKDYERKLRTNENAHEKKAKTFQQKICMQEKYIKTLEARVREHEEMKKLFYRTISEQAKTISQQNREIDDLIYRIDLNSSSSIDIVGILEEEWDKLRKAEPTSSPLKLWRKLMLKYHPDKLSSTLGTKMSTEISNILTNMKPE